MMQQQQHNTTMSSLSVAAAKGKRGVISLQGTRPLPLSLPGTSSSSPPPRPGKKRPRVDDGRVGGPPPPPAAAGPVIVYEYTPKVIHARPDEFKALVQRLTGRKPTGTAGGDQEPAVHVLPPAPAQTSTAAPSSSWQWQQQTAVVGGDPLVLTLGQEHVPPPPLPLDDHRHHHHTPPVLPSPRGAAGGFLLSSPGSFLFSPATMQAIQELIS